MYSDFWKGVFIVKFSQYFIDIFLFFMLLLYNNRVHLFIENV